MAARLWLTISLTFLFGLAQAQQDSLRVSAPDSVLTMPQDTVIQQAPSSKSRIKVIPDSLRLNLSVINAEDSEGKDDKEKADSIKTKKGLIRDFGIYLDYGKIAGYLTGQEQKNEVGVRLVFGNGLYLAAEYGLATLTPDNAYRNADYQVEGDYQRAGLGYLFAFNAKSNLGLGLMYGQAAFQDEGAPTIESPSGLFGTVSSSFARSGLTANWAELNLLSETRIANNLYLGLTLRLRFMIDYDAQEPIDVYTIPGYGRTFDNSVPAANLIIRYSF